MYGGGKGAAKTNGSRAVIFDGPDSNTYIDPNKLRQATDKKLNSQNH